MNLNGTEYYYTRNAQGDITGLIDGAKNQVVSYTYDTWGKLLSTTGSLAGSLGVKNPYRYRGYRYDNETGLYYLQSRYYNPDWGRFVNADAVDVLTATQGELKSHNLFAYGMNDPVNNIDEDGYLSKKSKWIIGGVVLTAVVVVVVIAATGGAASPLLLALKGSVAALKVKIASAVTGGLKSGFNIWKVIKATQPIMQGTNIPKSFEMTVGKLKFWVHANATKHMQEFISSAAKKTGQSLLIENELMNSFYTAVNGAVRQGIQYEKMMKINGWELIFSLPRDSGMLPVIKHALFKN